jgi:hypothetical protein
MRTMLTAVVPNRLRAMCRRHGGEAPKSPLAKDMDLLAIQLSVAIQTHNRHAITSGLDEQPKWLLKQAGHAKQQVMRRMLRSRRTRARVVELAIVAIAAIVMLSSCGKHTGPIVGSNTTSHSSGQLPSGTASGSISKPLDYPGNVHLDPPGNATPKLSAADAVAACNNPPVACRSGTPTRVELALMTAANFGANQRLVWAITWSGVDCMVIGPPSRPSPKYNIATGCDFTTFIDANTGAYLVAVDGPIQSG